MIELVIRLPSLGVLDKLLAFLQQMQIPYQTRTVEPAEIDDAAKKAAIFAKIQSGGMNIPNFDQFMLAFEESRQDRPLYGRD